MASRPRPDAAVDDLPAGLSNVLFEAWLVSRSVHARIDEAVAATGLDADEFAIYSVLAGSDGLTPTALAEWMAAPATTVSSYLNRFERRGHVRRLTNPADRRSHLLRLTAAGRRAHRDAGELFLPLLDQVNATIGDELPDTRSRLIELRRAVDAIE
ncbi:MAG: MarR family winged helix-turn-helix transcriptional regulator [Actinomycetota bacterium]